MYLGVDLGTSSIKTVVINDEGATVANSISELSISQPEPLWSEQNPVDWLTAAEDAIKKLPKEIRKIIKCVGLSGQMHGAVLLDKKGKPLRPAILWNDGRSFEECDELKSIEPQLSDITGNKIMPGFTSPKLRWIKKHEPEVFAVINKILLPKDYLRYSWTGDYATDVSDASGTLWLNVNKRKWSQTAIQASDLDENLLPTTFEGPEITGEISLNASKRLGIPRVPIVAGAGDQAAGAIGASVIRTKDASLVLGTSGVIFIVTDGFLPKPDQGVHAFCHAIPKKWHQMAVILSAASAIDWVAKITGFKKPEDAYRSAEKSNQRSKAMFLPYLSGERTPHNDPYAKGAFFGLENTTDKSSLIQAALEGVAFALTDSFQALQNAGGNCDTITVIGGGSRSVYWGKIIANCLNKTLTYREEGEAGPAKGAAYLALSGNLRVKLEELIKPMPVKKIIRPENTETEIYAEKISRWRSLYQSTKQLTK